MASIPSKVKSQVAGIGKQTGQQVLDQPFEIVDSAVDQVTGSVSENTPQSQGQGPQQQSAPQNQPAQPSLEEKKKDNILRSHKQELDEMIQKKRVERSQEKQDILTEEEIKKQAEEEQKAQNQPLPEIQSKPKIGDLFGIKKKQRSTEMAKTPTN